jgi:predicted CXXCH cytochrome family protein
MQVANSSTVKADFNGSAFTDNGIPTAFSKQGDRYMVRTDGPGGALADYPVAYTFGVRPLQQFLIAVPGGRFQALSVTWDTRSKAEGGQRWFHLYPGEKVDHRDVLHWTGPAQNWNYMCAECHSTNVRKGYSPESDTYDTKWSEINVSCESCHGPGSAHAAWARAGPGRRDPAAAPDGGRAPGAPPGQPQAPGEIGLAFSMKDAGGGVWAVPPGEFVAKRTRPITSRSEVETCARCHSRRAQIWEDYQFGAPIADTHRVSLIDRDLYEANGLQRDEVYEYGSFLQSRMYAAGVTCSDCHNPHSGRLKFDGNALCTQCHVPAKYDAPAHHRHPVGKSGPVPTPRPGGTGAEAPLLPSRPRPATQCVSCHMPERIYMVVDGRRDHGFKVPRPDESVKYGTPNACNDCHTTRTAAWAEKAVSGWFGAGAAARPSFTPALHAARSGWPEAGDMLARLAADAAAPAIVRATAVSLIRPDSTVEFAPAVERAAVDPDPLVRRSAAGAAAGMDQASAARILAFLLGDAVRTVRFEAVQTMAASFGAPGDAASRTVFDRVADELRASLRLNADRAESRVTLGAFEAALGRNPAAEAEYRAAIRLQPQFAPAYVNLSDVLRSSGRDADAEAALREGLSRVPALGQPPLQHALGLALIRQKRYGDAVPQLELASRGSPDDARFVYVYAVALHDTGQPAEARRVLDAAARRHPADPSILDALVNYSLEAGDRAAALRWADRLAAAAPANPEVAKRVAELRARQ